MASDRSGCSNNNNSGYFEDVNGNGGRRNSQPLPSGGFDGQSRHIHTLPFATFRELSVLLDVNDRWKLLGGTEMEFTMADLSRFEQMGRHSSYTMKMLDEWALRNHTVLELFLALHSMRMYQAMSLLKDHVSPRYHHLIKGPDLYPQLLPLGARPMESGGGGGGYDFNGLPSMMASGGCGGGGGFESDLPKPPLPMPSSSSSSSQYKCGNKPMPVQDTAYDDVATFGAAASSDSYCCGEAKFVSSFKCDPIGDVTAKYETLHIDPPSDVRKIVSESTKIGKVGSAPSNESTQRAAENSVEEAAGIVGRIPYVEVVEATNDFTTVELGRGGFGVVYEGRWRKLKVAIKRIEKKQNPGRTLLEEAKLRQSYVELETLNRCRYDNVLPLYGYAVDDAGLSLCLVYQFMVNGSLEDRLLRRGGTEPLTWLQRFIVAHGSARGLQYLHSCVPRIIHGDIKSANILLDVNFEPKIGDFGLAREGPAAECTQTSVNLSAVHGTPPYLPADFIRSRQLSTKVDTYSFGVVLLELATGLRAFSEDKSRQKNLRDHVACYDASKYDELRDGSAGDDRCGAFLMLIHEGRRCTTSKKKNRPEMADVFEDLDAKLKDLEAIVTRNDDSSFEISHQTPIGEVDVPPPPYLSRYSSDRVSLPVDVEAEAEAEAEVEAEPNNLPRLTLLGTKPPST